MSPTSAPGQSRPLQLSPMQHGARLGRVHAAIDRAGVDALLVTNLVNIRYLTGFTGSAAMLLVANSGLSLVTDGRYATQAAEQLAEAGVVARLEIHATASAQLDAIGSALTAEGVGRLGLEASNITWARQRSFTERFVPIEMVATSDLVEDLRRCKDAEEVARIRAACAIGDEALAAVAPTLAQRPRERDVALALEVEMRRRGASGTSFETIVASGPNAAKPHHRPTDRQIEHGELVVLDFGCIVDGYCSDMTRTLSVGDPGTEATRIYEVVRAAQQAGRDALKAGVTCAEVDEACRAVIAAAGWAEAFSHGTGHGVGLDIHEAPRVGATVRDTLAVGHVVTVEPGVYLPGLGGVRIEDTLVVTDEGADVLTTSPKGLLL